MSAFKGDYMGFSFGYKTDGTPMHSSDLGIVRVSNGSRFDENLLPTMQDKTVQVPGGDGTYYFGSYYTLRPFTIPFAFDGLTEVQIAQLKRHFGDKQIHDLVFDERPYKTYKAKVTGTATLKYLVFDEGEEKERVYKGEGTIQFTCYQPYAVCDKKWLDKYIEKAKNWEEGLYEFDTQKNRFVKTKDKYLNINKNYYKNIGNINEWVSASGLKENNRSEGVIYDSFTNNNNSINLYNPGDLETHFQLKINFKKEGKIPAAKLYIDEDTLKQLSWDSMSKAGNDSYVVINTKLNLIEGYVIEEGENGTKKEIKSGNIYNEYLIEGDFFKIPQQRSTLKIGVENDDSEIPSISIEYNYYYF